MSDNVKAWEAYEKAVAKTQSRSVDQKERISKMDDALKKLSYKDLKELGVSISDDAIIQETKAFKKTFEVAMGEFSSAITVEANNLVLTYLKHVAKKRLSKLRELKKVEEDAQSKGSKWGSYEVFEEDVHSDEGTSAKEREARKVLESHYNSFKSKLEKINVVNKRPTPFPSFDLLLKSFTSKISSIESEVVGFGKRKPEHTQRILDVNQIFQWLADQNMPVALGFGKEQKDNEDLIKIYSDMAFQFINYQAIIYSLKDEYISRLDDVANAEDSDIALIQKRFDLLLDEHTKRLFEFFKHVAKANPDFINLSALSNKDVIKDALLWVLPAFVANTTGDRGLSGMFFERIKGSGILPFVAWQRHYENQITEWLKDDNLKELYVKEIKKHGSVAKYADFLASEGLEKGLRDSQIWSTANNAIHDLSKLYRKLHAHDEDSSESTKTDSSEDSADSKSGGSAHFTERVYSADKAYDVDHAFEFMEASKDSLKQIVDAKVPFGASFMYILMLFQLPSGSGFEVIKKRYKEISRLLHPDFNPDQPKFEEIFRYVTQAYGLCQKAKEGGELGN